MPDTPQLPPRVVAVVVTFNRRALLERLLGALDGTPGLAEVVVVDNASTDGTGEWLATETSPVAPESSEGRASDQAAEGRERASNRDGNQAPARTPVHAVTLPENRGGAGGFHEGLRLAMERGADLAWLMDDDGVPEEGCLATLLEHAGELDFWGPAVLAEQDPSRLCFPIRLPGRTQVVHEMAAVRAAAPGGVLPDIVIPFNGVLVTRELADRIGLPREEFFIWGDDHEYRLRAEAAGARIATITGARFLHPATDDLGTPMMFGRTTYNHSPSDLKHYCMARNNVVNLREYRSRLLVLAFVLKTAWFYAFTRPTPRRLRLSAQGIVAGVRNDFSGHRRFLQ